MRKYRKFSEGGTAALDELASGREKGSFDEDTYARAKKFLERGGSDAPKAAPTKPKPKAAAPAPAPAPKAASAEIPKGGETAPASTGEDTSGPSNMDRIFMGLGAGAGIAGAAKLARLSRAEKAAKAAKEAASKFSAPQAAKQVTTETGRRFSPKAEMEAAESTMRGAVGRKQLQAKRAEAGKTAKARAETMEANKPVLQATPKKASPRARTRDEDVDYELRAKGGRIGYASGGSIRGGGCESRGKTKGRFV